MVDEISRAEERRGWRHIFIIGLGAIVVIALIVLLRPMLFSGDERSGMDQMADQSTIGASSHGAVATAVIETKNTGDYGTYLATEAGHPLYLFKADTRGADGSQAESKCYDDCAKAWPPLLTTDQPQARGEANGAMLATVARTDGAKQVTYNGWPLYRYAKDVGSDRVTGQDIEDFGAEWYLVTPAGEEVHADEGEGSG